MFETRPFIFLIDDDEDDLAMLSCSLAKRDIRTRTFTSGVRAMDCFDTFCIGSDLPSLIILDYNMPIMNGLEALSLIKKSRNIMHIPVIIYSTIINPWFEENARSKGAFACMSKAVNMDDFEEQVLCISNLAYAFLANRASVAVNC